MRPADGQAYKDILMVRNLVALTSALGLQLSKPHSPVSHTMNNGTPVSISLAEVLQWLNVTRDAVNSARSFHGLCYEAFDILSIHEADLTPYQSH